jgi:hypothetical protein
LIECGDSTKTQFNQKDDDITACCDIIDLNDDEKTPCSKKGGKMSAEKAMDKTKKNAEVGEESKEQASEAQVCQEGTN